MCETRLGRVPQPSPYARRILLCVTGLAPAVVTESVYALSRHDPPFHPTEVHVITTAEGAAAVRLALVDPRVDKLGALCRQYRLPLPVCDASTIHVIQHEGRDLADMRSAAENDSAADFILRVVRRLTADGDSQIHFSIAGGRKTMGFYLGYCASLLGRPQDGMSHVLVNAPFENLPNFYFPLNPPEVIESNGRLYDTGRSRVDLAPVAFLRLRPELPRPLIEGNAGFGEMLALLGALQGRPRLVLRLLPGPEVRGVALGEVEVGSGYKAHLPARSFALLWMFAKLARSSDPAKRTVTSSDWRPPYQRIAHAVYGALTGKGSVWERDSGRVMARKDKFLMDAVYKLSEHLAECLGPRGPEVYGVARLTQGGSAFYGLKLPPDAIHLQDEARLADQV